MQNTAPNCAGISSNSSLDSTIISNNIISDNNASGTGGGICSSGTISNNHIVRNSAQNASAINYAYVDNQNIYYNTITGNIANGIAPTYAVYVNSHPLFNYNNIFNNSGVYELCNNNAQGSANIDATSNWWGTGNSSVIQTKIYDWFDDSTKGIVDYSPYSASTRTDAPISPPTGLTATAGSGTISLSWSTNPESNIAGYRVYWGSTSGHPYSNSFDVGNVTSYTIPNLPIGKYYAAVTAYDISAGSVIDDPTTIINEKQTSGHESWYAEENSVSISTSPFAPAIQSEVPDEETVTVQAEPQAKGGCFIATAAYGSYLDPHVQVLRDFRDRWLLSDITLHVMDHKITIPNTPGKAFVCFYYKYSPPIAEFIREHDVLQAVVRWLLTPIVLMMRYPIAVMLVLIIGFGLAIRKTVSKISRKVKSI
jgi:hypothetical protein